MSTIDNPDRVKEYFRRREDLDTRKSELAEDLKELKTEFKDENFDMKALEEAYKISQMDPDEKSEKDFVIESYLEASKA